MARTQRFIVTLQGVEHQLIYTRPRFRRMVILEIDGERYELPRGERQEPFILGGEQAILHIHRDGCASITTRAGDVVSK